MLLLACSGPCVQYVMERATQLGWAAGAVAAVVGVALAVMSWRAGQRHRAVVALAAVAVHPAWLISAYSGDCGGFRVLLCGLITGTLLGVGAVEVFARANPDSRQNRRVWLVAFAVAFAFTAGLDALKFSFRGAQWEECDAHREHRMRGP